MKEISLNKIIIIAFVSVCLVIGAVTVILFFSKSDNTAVSVFDAQGNAVAEVSRAGDSFEISAENDVYGEYVEIAVKEAIDLYAEKCNVSTDEKNAAFFENVRKVNTYLIPDYLLKVKEAKSASALKDNTPFASVVISHSGELLAIYGSADSEGNNYSQKKTYAGSTIKPLSVYGPLIEKGSATCSTVFTDSPIKKIADSEGRYIDWPSNASGDYSYREITVAEALHKSLNTIAVRGLQELSVTKSVSFLEENFGINLEYEKETVKKAGEEEVLGNIALGYLYEGVSPVDMAGYYQVFANGGTYTSPHCVSSIETADGNAYSQERKAKEVLSLETSSIMRELLKGVVTREGTAQEAFVEDVEIAGKSGTSDGYADNWFVGFTTEYICSVWHGYNEVPKNSAAKMFSEIVSRLPAYDDGFTLSDGIVRKLYCKETGLLKGKFCDKTEKGFYKVDVYPERCTDCE